MNATFAIGSLLFCKKPAMSILFNRDLKPENLLFEDKDGDLLKLIDFGLAAKLEIGDKLTEKLGSVN